MVLSKNLKRVAVLATLVVVAVVAWRVVQHLGAPQINYETGTIDRGTVDKTVSSTGSVDALVTVEVGSVISGQISELHADFNSTVKKGDLLAVIDPQIYQQRVASAEADLAVARATVGSQQAALNKAKTSVEQAQRDYNRQEQLAAQKLVAQSAAEDSRKTLALAQSDVVIAQAQVKNAEANLQTRQAALEQTRIDLSHTQIRAPIDGIVISRNVDLGQTVAASLQAPVLFKIAQDLSRIQIEAKVDEADIGSISTGDPATFSVDAFPDQTFTGQVAQVRLAATTVQNVVTYSVMVQARNPRQMLLPGMTANVSITTEHRENVMRVANDATRFKPADVTSSTTSNFASSGSQGGNRSGGRNFLDNEQMLKDLGVTKDQQEKLRKSLQAMFEQMQSQQGNGPAGLGGGGPPNFRQQNQQQEAMRNRFENVLSSVLTPDQMDKYHKLNSQRGMASETRSGTLYTLVDGKPKSHDVTFGVADDRFTEIVEAGDLKVGDSVILRARAEGVQ